MSSNKYFKIVVKGTALSFKSGRYPFKMHPHINYRYPRLRDKIIEVINDSLKHGMSAEEAYLSLLFDCADVTEVRNKEAFIARYNYNLALRNKEEPTTVDIDGGTIDQATVEGSAQTTELDIAKEYLAIPVGQRSLQQHAWLADHCWLIKQVKGD